MASTNVSRLGREADQTYDRPRLCAASVVIILLTPSALIGWGTEGHEIVASLAETRLTEKARRGVHSLIGDASLASIATWADEVRPECDEAYNWHFVDIPKEASGFSDERDRFLPNDKHKNAATDCHNCVVDRIEIFKQVLSDSSASGDERTEALKFLVHFDGDLHQPFHAIGEVAGGNTISVTQFGSTDCGRHACKSLGHRTHPACWIGHRSYVAHLEKLITDEHLTASRNPEAWANESPALAQLAWLPSGAQIDENYYREQIKVVDKRLALAGLRLASVLNEAFARVQ